MPLRQAQEAVAAFVEQHGLEADAVTRLLDVTSELGEVAKELLKSSRYGQQPFNAGPSWSEELGDLLFSFLALGNATGVNLDAALSSALAKYERRLAEEGSAGSGR